MCEVLAELMHGESCRSDRSERVEQRAHARVVTKSLSERVEMAGNRSELVVELPRGIESENRVRRRHVTKKHECRATEKGVT